MALSCIIDEKTVGYLKVRLSLLEKNRKQVIESLLTTTKSINDLKEKVASNKLNKSSTILQRIEELENDLCISSYSKEETRIIENQISNLKQELLLVKQHSLLEEELKGLREKKKCQLKRLSELRKEITEVDAAICVAWVIVFSRRQKKEITPDVVMSEMLPMTEKQFIQLRKRPTISKIEYHHCIKITYTHSLSSCIIYGEASSIATTLPLLQDSLHWSVQTIPFSAFEIAVLLFYNCKYLHWIEQQTNTIFFIKTSSKHISFQGGSNACSKALSIYQSFFQHAPTVQLSEASFKRLAGKGSVYFNAIKAKFPCFFYLLYNSHSLRFYGTEEEIQKIRPLLINELKELEEKKEIVNLSNSLQVSYLIGEKGSKIRELTSVTHCSCQCSNKNETPAFELYGCKREIEAAKEWIERELQQFNQLNFQFNLPELGIPLLLNHQGRELQRIENETHTRLIINKEENYVFIRGKQPSFVDQAKNALITLFNSISSHEYFIPIEVRNEFIGKKGEHINSLRRQFHVSIQLNEGQLKCEGVNPNLSSCNEYLIQWLKNHTVEYLQQSKDIVGKVIVGKQGQVIQALEKQYHLRIQQKTQEESTTLAFIGKEEDVKSCLLLVSQKIEGFLSTHYSIQFSMDEWNWCPSLTRTSISTLQHKYPQSTITVIASTGKITCEGPPADIAQIKEVFETIKKENEDRQVFAYPVKKQYAGIIIGKSGKTIHDLEEQYHVVMKLQQEKETLFLWCSETQWNTIQSVLNSLIEEKAIITKTLDIDFTQQKNLLVDKCKPIQTIQSSFNVTITLPARNEKTLTISGNRGNCEKAIQSIQSIIKGIYTYHYHYNSTCLQTLIQLPTFHIERIALANHCNIQYDSHGNVDIRGSYEAIHHSHSLLYSQLTLLFPDQFKQIPLSSGVAYYLINNKHSLSLETPTCTIHVEPAEKMVYIFGNPTQVQLKYDEYGYTITRLATGHVMLSFEKELYSTIVGLKGQYVKVLEKEYQVKCILLRNSNEVYLEGENDAVKKVEEILVSKVKEQKERCSMISTTPALLTSFIEEYGDLVKEWEKENQCELKLDEKNHCICIYSDCKENVESMRFIVENMLETIEIDQEKNAFVVEESDVQDEDHVDHVDLQDLQDDESQDSTDAKQQIDLLLGLTSV